MCRREEGGRLGDEDALELRRRVRKYGEEDEYAGRAPNENTLSRKGSKRPHPAHSTASTV
jgi:hypothetical protein